MAGKKEVSQLPSESVGEGGGGGDSLDRGLPESGASGHLIERIVDCILDGVTRAATIAEYLGIGVDDVYRVRSTHEFEQHLAAAVVTQNLMVQARASALALDVLERVDAVVEGDATPSAADLNFVAKMMAQKLDITPARKTGEEMSEDTKRFLEAVSD